MAIFQVKTLRDQGIGSLRNALAQANLSPGKDTIEFAERLAGETINLDNGELVVTDDVVIQNTQRSTVKISGENRSRIFRIDDGTAEKINVTLSGLTVTQGNVADSDGGGILNLERLRLLQSSIMDNQAAFAGGGIANQGGLVQLIDSRISGNTLPKFEGGDRPPSGVGIHSVDGRVIIRNSKIEDNRVYAFGIDYYDAFRNQPEVLTSQESGGGIALIKTDAKVFDSLIQNNLSFAGGGISARDNSRLTIQNSEISGNEAVFRTNGDTNVYPEIGLGGGGIFAEGSTVTINHSLIQGNRSADGGGLFISNSEVQLTNSIIDGNAANLEVYSSQGGIITTNSSGFGGGILAQNSQLQADRITVSNNRTVNAGGGVLLVDGTTSIRNSSIQDNQVNDTDRNTKQRSPFASGGGGLYNAGELKLSSSTISGNRIGVFNTGNPANRRLRIKNARGGGLLNRGTATISNSTIAENQIQLTTEYTADAAGGGIFNQGQATIQNSTIAFNKISGDGYIDPTYVSENPTFQGGGLRNTSAGVISISNSLVAQNTIELTDRIRDPLDELIRTQGPDIAGTIKSLGFNLVGVRQGSEGLRLALGDQRGTEQAPLDPLIQPLADNGGVTSTIALRPGSPAIDIGDPDFDYFTSDQRGSRFTRVVDGDGDGNAVVDVGAFELSTWRILTPKDDRLRGTSLAEQILGLGGNDTLSGAIGNDVILGHGGDDILRGNAGADQLVGGAQGDRLLGGPGEDTLTGGTGRDQFVFTHAQHQIDTITDFNVRQDLLRFRAEGFGGGLELLGSTIPRGLFTVGTSATQRSHRFIYNSMTGALQFDRDGTGQQSAIAIAFLTPGLDLQAANFRVF